MRKLLISLLLAGAAASPALASPESDREQAREERAQAREQRQQAREARPERSRDVERPQVARPDRPDRPAPQVLPVDRQVRVQDVEAARSARRDSVDLSRAGRVEQRQQLVDQRQQRVDQMRDNRSLRQSDRPLPRVLRTRTPIVSHIPREGTQPPPPATARPASQPQWSTSWRHNHKYDWHNWRKHHHSWFHLGFYYDPFGWGYSPYEIGWRLWPSYYSSRYWINDPWRYRLPYAPPGY